MMMDAQFFSFVFCCFVLILNVRSQVTTSDGLKFCLPQLEGWKFEDPDTERCYQFVTDKGERRSWSDARDYCQVNGGRLLNIEDEKKQKMVEFFLNDPENLYKPGAGYDPKDSTTWGDYDPDVWIGATRDSDGSTWRFDQYQTSRTVRSVIVTWFNYGSDETLINAQNAEKNRYSADTCLFMRFNWKNNTLGTFSRQEVSYPWYQGQLCSSSKGPKHSFICEYEGYEYLEKGDASSWVIVIAVLGVFVSCGFFACTIYCLWDKIHTSYNVLQV